MPRDREFELKFALGEEEVQKLNGHPLLASADGASRPAQRFRATYFDTANGKLRRKKVSLRVRQEGDRRKQTLKSGSGSAIDRGEWEAEATGEAPSPEWLAGTPLRRLFRRGVGAELVPSFTVDVERQIFNVKQGTAEIEAALDRGAIEAAGRSLPISEFELELKQGEPADLFRLARTLVADLALTPSLISKAERGYRLRDGDWGHPARVEDASLAPDMSTASAFQAIAETCLREMMLNLAAFAPDGDIEIVHRSRVALRRLRAAMTLFTPVIEDSGFAHLRGEFKWMSDLLGTARDLDVFQSEVFGPAARNPELLGAHELADHMRVKQREAHLALAGGLASSRWRIALNELIAWLADGEWRGSKAAAEPVGDFVVPRLKKRLKAVAVGVDALRDATPHERHQLRIRAKKLRYALEFFAGTVRIGKGSKRYKTLLNGLETLQSALGQLHDHEARQDLLRRETFTWEADGAGDERATFAAGVLANDAPDSAGLMAEAAKALRTIGKAKPF